MCFGRGRPERGGGSARRARGGRGWIGPSGACSWSARRPSSGRDGDLERLLDTWRKSSERGGSLLLGGPNGVGKSRLVYEFLERVAADGTVAVAAGRFLGAEGGSYQAYLDALGDLLIPLGTEPGRRKPILEERLGTLLGETPGVVPALADFLLGGFQLGAEGALSKDAVHAAFTRTLRRLAREQPLILVLEDLQQAGSDAVDLLRYGMRAAADHPLFVIGVYAEDGVDEAHPFHGLAAGPLPDRVERYRLDPLHAGAAAGAGSGGRVPRELPGGIRPRRASPRRARGGMSAASGRSEGRASASSPTSQPASPAVFSFWASPATGQPSSRPSDRWMPTTPRASGGARSARATS